MADGRCITSFDSNRLMNESIMAQQGITPEDNYAYRRFLQAKGPDAINLPLRDAACGSKR
jgi:hypothetical protein